MHTSKLAFIIAVALFAVGTGAAMAKTLKECKADEKKCRAGCDQLIDYRDAPADCKERCTDEYLLCQLPDRPGDAKADPGAQPTNSPPKAKQSLPVVRPDRAIGR